MFKLLLLFSFIAVALAGTRFGSLRKAGGRIVGGDEVEIEDFPYQVSLRYYGEHMCGGSVLSETRILTAAHCTDGFRAAKMSIMVGNKNVSQGDVYNVAGVAQHPRYNDETVDYDMAILILADPIKMSNKVNTIDLQEKNVEVQPGTESIVSGWGALFENDEETPAILRKTNVDVISKTDCEDAYGTTRITEHMLCARREGHDSCQGDSGGPLVANNKLIGVVSWGYGCARPKYPGIYSKVSSLREWIDLHL